MPAPRFTLDHLQPLQQHIQDDGQPRRLVHTDPMTDLERDCLELGLLDARGFTATITPAGLALVQALDACLELRYAAAEPRYALLDGDDTIVQLPLLGDEVDQSLLRERTHRALFRQPGKRGEEAEPLRLRPSWRKPHP